MFAPSSSAGSSPGRRRPAAFFDLDKTLLLINSGTSWMKFQYRRGTAGKRDLIKALYWSSLYKMAVLDMKSLATRLVADLEGNPVDDMIKECEIWHRTEIRHQLAPAGLRALEHHRARGDITVILTASTQFVADVLRRDLGFDHSLCSRLEVDRGRFTGRLETLCYGPGKVEASERLAEEANIDLDASTFYTDSFTDVPMLERVGHPVVVNPDPRLLRYARRRGWPIETWGPESKGPGMASKL